VRGDDWSVRMGKFGRPLGASPNYFRGENMVHQKFRAITSWAAAALLMGSVGVAQATEGYFQHGYGARNKAVAGAGVADTRDATAVAVNPAGLVHVDDQFNMSVSAFSPRREFKGGPANPFPGFTPPGTIESQWNWFYIPNMARSWRVDNPYFDVFAVSMYGNGGMNTHFPEVLRPDGGCGAGGGTGIFCRGLLGVNLNQAFMSAAVAKKFGNVSVGIAPIFAVQQIELHGLGAFAGASSDPANLTNQGMDTSWGGGVRGGIEVAVTPNVRVGVAGNSRIYMSEFDEYRGLFAEQGGFDIPPSLQVGVAVDARPNLTFMADYKHIWYGSVNSIANPSTNVFSAPLGADNGAGFGWQDIGIFKFGVEWRPNDTWTWRAGYAHSDDPIGSRDVMFNILAPGIIEHEFTGGAKYKWSDKIDLEVAGMYAPENSLNGFELAAPFGNPTHAIEVSMYQFEITAGVTWKFGAQPEPVALK